MSNKISKSDTTPEMEKRDADARASLSEKVCQHFAVGTSIHRRYQRGEIIERFSTDGSTYLRIRWEDGSVSLTKPHALNRRF